MRISGRLQQPPPCSLSCSGWSSPLTLGTSFQNSEPSRVCPSHLEERPNSTAHKAGSVSAPPSSHLCLLQGPCTLGPFLWESHHSRGQWSRLRHIVFDQGKPLLTPSPVSTLVTLFYFFFLPLISCHYLGFSSDDLFSSPLPHLLVSTPQGQQQTAHRSLRNAMLQASEATDPGLSGLPGTVTGLCLLEPVLPWLKLPLCHLRVLRP